MRTYLTTLTVIFSFLTLSLHAAPQKLRLQNQFGESSQNWVQGTYMPFPGTTLDLVYFSGATTPVNGGSGTGVGIAGKGSMYTARDTGVLYLNTGTKSSPTWSSSGTTTNAAIIAATLTAFSAGAGTVSSADSILTAFQKLQGNDAQLKNGTFTPSPETVSSAGAISTTLMESIVANATGSSYAATLAAPSSQDGQIKIIKMTTATSTVTLAMTNVATSGAYTPAGTTTLTFSATGHSAVFIAVGSKWVYLGGSAVAS